MIYSDIEYENKISNEYDINDITVVYGIRLDEFNPWILERLDFISQYYTVRPNIQIADLGSKPEYSKQLSDVCNRHGFSYLYVDDNDNDLFSPAMARNAGFSQIKTKLVFFCDIDMFSSKSLFLDLVDAANTLELDKYFDKIINLPIYHFNEKVSPLFFDAPENADKYIKKLFSQSVFSKKGEIVDFVAPYSNIFLCRTDYFNYIGGYNENFRGHGSEDFEFFIRQSFYSNRLPKPKDFGSDYYGPLRDSFYKFWKEYKGFRRFFELLSLEAELHGLKVGHFWHPKPKEHSWIAKNDWKRSIFNEQSSKYLTDEKNLIDFDWLPRTKKTLVLIKHVDHANFAYPLRLAGHKLELLKVNSDLEKSEVIRKIDSGYYDNVCMFNPYMKSHSDLYMYFSYAKTKGLKPIIIERGALPESWYYAEDMSYVDPDFINLSLDEIEINNIPLISNFLSTLRQGGHTLENNGNYESTINKYKISTILSGTKIFIPLQLSEDVAITRFNEGKQNYLEFVSQLYECANLNSNILFFIKVHPLSKDEQNTPIPSNVILCGESDNIHAMIDLSDSVICYNSGVGLISLLHGKKTIAVGNAYYVNKDLAYSATDIFDALKIVNSINTPPPTEINIQKFASWLINDKYSFYKSESIIKDFGHRKSHGYNNSKMYSLNYEVKFRTQLSCVSQPFSEHSYGSAKLMISPGIHRASVISAPVAKVIEQKKTTKNQTNTPDSMNSIELTPPSKNTSNQKIKKLIRTPKLFFVDSKKPYIKKLGLFLFK